MIHSISIVVTKLDKISRKQKQNQGRLPGLRRKEVRNIAALKVSWLGSYDNIPLSAQSGNILLE